MIQGTIGFMLPLKPLLRHQMERKSHRFVEAKPEQGVSPVLPNPYAEAA
jgi:hypothetical protein